MKFTCPVCGETSKQYAPWYKASRGTLATHLYNAHAEELRQRLNNPHDSVIAKLLDGGLKVTRSHAAEGLPVRIAYVKRWR